MATDLERLVVRLEAQMRQYEREWQKARDTTDRQTKAIERRVEATATRVQAMMAKINGTIAGGLVGAAAGIAGGLAGLLTGREFFKNTIEAEAVVAQLEAAIRATGGAAGYSSKQLQDMAGEIQKVTIFGDEAVMTAQTMLLRFTRIGHDVFPEALKAATNLSAGLGQDLTTAAQMVGRALDNPAEGLQRLRRSGIQFTEQQKEQIKALVESGKVVQAQGVILKEIENRFGGAAEAARNTLGGALTSLKNAFGDLFEVPKNDTVGLRIEIEKLVAFLQSPSTISAIQSFGAALFNFIAEELRGLQNDIKTFRYEMDQLSRGNLREAIGIGQTEGIPLAARKLRIGLGNQISQREADAFYGVVSTRFDKPIPPPAKPAALGGGGTAADDALKKEEDRINKRIKLLEAEVATLGMTTKAREKARVEAELWAAAEKAGIPASEELRSRIGALGDKFGEVAQRAETAKSKFKEIESAAKDFSSAVSDGFKGMILEGKKFNEVLSDMSKRFAGKAIDKIFDTLFFGSTGKLTTGQGIFGSLLPIGQNAGGTGNWRGGPTWVGERGPELINLPRGSQITPNHVAKNMGGPQAMNVTYNIDASGTDQAAIARLERVLVAQSKQLASTNKAMISAQRFQVTGVM